MAIELHHQGSAVRVSELLSDGVVASPETLARLYQEAGLDIARPVTAWVVLALPGR